MTIDKAIDDSDYFQALFDSIVAASNNQEVSAKNVLTADKDNAPDKVINKVGNLTRVLHECLKELGYDQNLKRAASAIPVARDRINSVATMTQQAATKVLNATDAAQPVMEKIEIDSQRLAREWQKLLDNKYEIHHFKNLAMQTHALLVEIPTHTKATNAYLMDIMMAQDFQDLTGQVIKKIVDVTQQMEKQLVEILVENPPSTASPDAYDMLLSGTATGGTGQTDVVGGQDQVDKLLESLGF